MIATLTLTIAGTPYEVTPDPADDVLMVRAWRLSKPDGKVYDVAEYLDHCTCDCPDFVFRRDGLDAAGCKHIRAAAVVGLIEMPRPAREAVAR